MSAILLTPSGALCCSWCGNHIDGLSWQSAKARGYFCGKECRDNGQGDEDYIKAYPRN